MTSMLFIGACLLLGMLLAHRRAVPENFTASLNALAIQVALPALVLRSLHALPLDGRVLLPFCMPWAVFIISAIAVRCAAALWPMDGPSRACLTLLCGTGNTSIIGIPLVATYLGADAIGLAVVADQSNFIVMCTLGMWSVAAGSGKRGSLRAMAQRMLHYPPQQAMLLALILRPWSFPDWLDQGLAALGALLTPIAVISVGAGLLQQRTDAPRSGLFVQGMVIKLLLVPACIFGLYGLLGSCGSPAFPVSVLQSAMPPMIVAGLIAVDQNLNPALAMRLLALGIPISFISTFGWSLLLGSAGGAGP
ncbi:AEC family transporter [Verminephrobacter aporrectodeae subsp. tuberculatae]|uniref:AEC family transporter n=2 Tax=Verminephrobacter TaxID=364316 RepID=A0ABT3KQ18_9BURK|nr:AEC family transporter [Verminephrobacter aporrectodeae]MCW5220618.1 AEC family transporter [Verminephrobacter aporrectodeae subsp. tuberculatae]MCW5289913.1 AEC family transporter [Verminephrobacter aporrectodeae subsp. tuberculatae]MCW5320411.1 AEC family transporter [Verminephrobacter aporrectodeae subsp. tuberculatae]MCW8166304.1 AEC family transporter [Verminephrobacter aporrectodeae subsp. tuberculatae]MCW8170399.1 AEC family transporter [Verminephrobacter aporrectodeae subsp. tubercu